jgi:hypothetical protein
LKIKNLLFHAVLIISAFTISTGPSFARDWDDLYDKTSESFYGSEKAEKIPSDAWIFYQKENWKDHHSTMILELYKYTDYPKYTSSRMIPFWYGLDSKIDNRSFSFIPITLTYWETDGSVHKRRNPFFFDTVDTAAGYDKKRYERTNFSLIHFYDYQKNSDGNYDRTFWFPIVPIFYRNSTDTGGHQNFLYLIDYTWKTSAAGTNIDRFWFVPFLFHKAGNDGYTAFLPPLIVDNRHKDGRRYSHALPFFINDRSIYVDYSGGKASTEYDHSIYTLLFYYNRTDSDTWGGNEISSQLNIPIIPLLYYSYEKKGVESYKNILLANWRRDGSGGINRLWLSPFYYWEKDSYRHILPPLFMNFFNSSTDGATGKKTLSTLRFSPFYGLYSERVGSPDGEDTVTRTMIPIVPVLYYSYEEKGVESRKNILLANWHRNGDGEMDSFWFSPLYYWKKNSYRLVAPPLFMNFFGSYADSSTGNKICTTTRLSPFYGLYSENENSPDGEETLSQTLIPIVPVLYFSNREKDKGSTRNAAVLFNWHNAPNGNTDRFWFSPFVYWKSDSYFHFTPLLYFSFMNSSREYGEDTKTVFSRLNVSPWYTSYNERDGGRDGEETFSRTLFPVIPALLYSEWEKDKGSVRNAAVLFNWHNDKEGNTDRFWFSPVFYWKSGSYAHVLPPFIMNFNGSDYSYSHIFPLYFGYERSLLEKNPDGNSERKLSAYTQVTPFFVRHNEYDEKNETIRSRFFWPIVPLYYRYRDETGTHANVLGLFDAGWSRDGSFNRFWTIPFVFWKSGEGGYKVAAPFYFRPSGWSETEGYSFGLFHYNSWSAGRDTTVIWPLIHYRDDDRDRKTYTNLWMPLYWNFETPERKTTLFLPLYFDTKNEKTGKEIYINISGYSRSIASGMNPNVSLGAGKSEYGYYLDTDISWLYDVVSYADRTTVFKTAEKIEQKQETPSLADRNSDARENSVSYSEFKFMFGLLDIKKTDSKRHFRLLPLAWLSWDDSSSDKVFWCLNTVSYNDGKDTDYFVFFPMYGSQHVGNSYRYGFLLNLFWNEYDDETKMREKTVLWPFINWYSSPEKSGGRFAPFVWHKRWIENDTESSRWVIFPLMYHRSTYLASSGETTDAFSISPVHYYSFEKNGESSSKRYFFPIIPVGYHSETAMNGTRDATSWIFPFYFGGEHTFEENGATVSTASSLYPLFLRYSSSRTETSETGEPKKYSKSFTLGYYSSSTPDENYWTFLGLVSGTSARNKSDGESNLLFGLYSDADENGTHRNILVPLWWYSSSERGYSFYTALGLFHSERDNDRFISRFTPLYSYESTASSRDFSLLLGLFGTERNTSDNSASTTFLWHLAGTDHHEREYTDNGVNRMMTDESTWFVPFGFGSRTYDKDDPSIRYERSQWTLLHHYSFERRKDGDETTTWWAPIVPLVYRYSDSSYSHTNALLLFDYSHDRKDDSRRLWAIPAFFVKSGPDGYCSILPPVFTHWWNEKSGESSYFAMGFYKTSSPDYERENAFYLFDHIRDIREKTESYGMLFNMFGKTESEKDIEYSLLWGAGARYRSFKDSGDYEASAICSIIKFQRADDYFHSRFLPLWYYERDRRESTLIIPPLLAYDHEKTDGSEFALWGAGIAYYRNKDVPEKTDNQKVLGGIIYDRVSEPERGYTSKGILWGLLFEYKEETETDYEEYSLLKGMIYKRTHLKGETKDRLFGIDL